MSGPGKIGQPSTYTHASKNIDSADVNASQEGVSVEPAVPQLNRAPFNNTSGETLRDRKVVSVSLREDRPPINVNVPFNRFWQDEGKAASSGVVSHKIMRRRDSTDKVVWHVKTPGYELGGEKFKRFLQKVIYLFTRKSYKAKFYNNPKLLVQREIFAANVYRAVVGAGNDYQVEYSRDERDKSDCIASRHLYDHKVGESYFTDKVSKPVFNEERHPAVDLCVRRFLLGDQDYLKPDNYMYTESSVPGKSDWVSIDFGMAFYNHCDLPEDCTLDEFTEIVFSPSNLHRFQYRGKETVLDMFGKDLETRRAYAKIALDKIADLSDEEIEELGEYIHDRNARYMLTETLKYKCDMARCILGREKGWPILNRAKGF
ncbi:hypothetical protein EOPP23_20620 [Endozoicomonas sp. OPT23]|uniref:hypothetical protein n=1 Tax=Endozoicomonas sp. OPT23 TaxID=2072845 RepID=UPI00129B8AC9|nr:hypothetical protein [Endozoicomonas sp. OPT23]MRI35367.1 hypothetical protein [Endozoicomonas sp. OPT23]